MPAAGPTADVRLWVDRAFHVRGTGTVVTGTLPAGTLRVGDGSLVDGQPVRVRGLECLGEHGHAGVGRCQGRRCARRPARRHAPVRVLVTPDAFDAVEVSTYGSGAGTPCPSGPCCTSVRRTSPVHARPLGDHSPGCGPSTRSRCGSATARCSGTPAAGRSGASRCSTSTPPPCADAGRLLAGPRRSRRSTAPWPPTWPPAAWSTAPACGERDPRHTGAGGRAGARRMDPVEPETYRLRVALSELVDPPPQRASRRGGRGTARAPPPRPRRGTGRPPLRDAAGRIARGDELPDRLVAAVTALRDDLAESPFAAPDADRLGRLGLEPQVWRGSPVTARCSGCEATSCCCRVPTTSPSIA